jgi:hypothetical protein
MEIKTALCILPWSSCGTVRPYADSLVSALIKIITSVSSRLGFVLLVLNSVRPPTTKVS